MYTRWITAGCVEEEPLSSSIRQSIRAFPMKRWAQKTVSGSLDRVEYLGHTENFKTASKNYRSNTGTCTARKYTDPEELTAEMLNELVNKIIIHAPDKSSGHRRQKIEIYYKAAGIIDIADDLCEAGDGRGQWRKERKMA